MTRLPSSLASLAPELKALVLEEIQRVRDEAREAIARAREEAFADALADARRSLLASTRKPPKLPELGPGSRVALYMRVSTEEQDLALQERELAQFVERRGYVVASTFKDDGVSSRKAYRPGLQKMLRQAAKRRFDAIVVWKTDRFYRDTLRFLLANYELSMHGVHFVSVTEHWDTTTPEGEMLQTFCAAVAKMENRRHGQRVAAGMAAAKELGTVLGRKRALNPEQLELALRRVREGGPGAAVRAIARELGMPRSTVGSALRAARAAPAATSPTSPIAETSPPAAGTAPPAASSTRPESTPSSRTETH